MPIKKQKKGYKQRNVDIRDEKKRFLIVCEGEKTEPNYFRGFKPAGTLTTIKGVGYNTLSLVNETIRLRDENTEPYDQVWCVFDKDSFSSDLFNRARYLAEQENIKVAYSNEAFELWYLLHFNYYDTALSRSEYVERLTRLLGMPYRKNDKGIYQQLRGKQVQALQNAERLLSQYVPPNPAEDNPSTTVHLLVQELNKSLP